MSSGAILITLSVPGLGWYDNFATNMTSKTFTLQVKISGSQTSSHADRLPIIFFETDADLKKVKGKAVPVTGRRGP
jgi:hypothetical protein